MPLVYYKMYRQYFEDVRFRFVPFNLPPGGVYVCRGFSGAPCPAVASAFSRDCPFAW